MVERSWGRHGESTGSMGAVATQVLRVPATALNRMGCGLIPGCVPGQGSSSPLAPPSRSAPAEPGSPPSRPRREPVGHQIAPSPWSTIVSPLGAGPGSARTVSIGAPSASHLAGLWEAHQSTSNPPARIGHAFPPALLPDPLRPTGSREHLDSNGYSVAADRDPDSCWPAMRSPRLGK